MDNLTHTLVGVGIAEGAFFLQERSDLKVSRAELWIASLLANNLPDHDFLYSWLTPGRLGNLLHHRGHTHTVVGLIPQLMLIWGILWLYEKRKQVVLRVSERILVLVVSFGGLAAHIVMDSLNNYGVHPFWPLDNRWLYGDALFIVEPWLWFAFLPLAASAWRKRGSRFWYAMGALCLVAVFATGAVPWLSGLFMLGWTLLACAIGRNVSLGRRLAMCWSLAFAVVCSFTTASRDADKLVRDGIRKGSSSTVHDVALSPFPGNPFCWSFVSVESDPTNNLYTSRQGVVAPYDLVPVSKCQYFKQFRPHSADRVPIKAARITWSGQRTFPLREMSSLAIENCGVAAFLRFARAPFFHVDSKVTAVDLRFDRAGMSFTRMEFPVHPASCPMRVPPWDPPTRSWLEDLDRVAETMQ